ncbi:T9SS type A sorting domain-containing protein [Croceimicrobium hydrocarbonivorans]|uniref:T9SS type A sorting domain-containing protein n=1 Tax=Croceimicrobium hydrocarbonivorans TaxID=2761580 RepID=A0A7H0VH59_9FLAO|nr:T9SS type A sorting domain-containing protein [Croceimicrobium hydrocarbonivorans]QNR25057.1 T9SS type A sorting domain-containing protein [Croceimicrobium hydrocarbonivorans]
MTQRQHLKLLPLFALSILCFALQAQRQEYLSGISALPLNPETQAQPLAKSNAVLSLPFVDDFSYNSNIPDPSKWEVSDIWVNQTWAISPISLGVASFDGLNRYGRPYSAVPKDSICDILISQSINLNSPTDSVYLSFYYQAGGWGEQPAVGTDSLILQFWNDQNSNWESVWSNETYPTTYFKNAMVYVPNRYHQANFKFRFYNYGAYYGALDTWHIDYVYLNDRRSFKDSIPNDIAFTRPHPSLLINYESVPWWHINQAFNIQSIFKKEVDLYYRRNRQSSASKPNLNLGFYEVSLNGNLLQKQVNTSATLEQGHLPNEETQYTIPQVGEPRLNFVNPPYSDEFEFRSYHTFNGVNFDIPENDTIRRIQVFKNYYAYDDGSAERAYEIRNNRGGFIVQRYDVLVNDTLKGLQIYFQPALYDLDNQEFSILLLSNTSGLPSSIIYETDSIYTAQYTDANFYQSYMLDTAIAGPVTTGTVFIGIRQKNSDPLSLGYDQNSRNRTTAFYGELNDMYQSFLGGTIMMRPIFRYAPRDLSQKEEFLTDSFQVYPNPSDGDFQFELPADLHDLEGYQLSLYNLQGQLLAQKAVAPNWDLSHLPSGLYLIRLADSQGKSNWQQKIQIY